MNKGGQIIPCPCGSGKPAQQCCFLLVDTGGRPHVADDAIDREIGELLSRQPVQSLEHLQALTAEVVNRRNRTPRADFHGLTPEQMHHLLHFPFTSPHLVAFPDPIEGTLEAPLLTLFRLLAEGVGEAGVKPTATGNLPRALCREIALRFLGEEEYQSQLRWGAIQKEVDFSGLHVARIVAGMAGLLRKYKGRFVLTREYLRRLATAGDAGVYPALFRAYVGKFNWLYGTRFPDAPFLQHSFLFSLYLLSRLGNDWRLTTEYEDAFLGAFPQVLDAFIGNTYFTPESSFRAAYRSTVLFGFASQLGLAEWESVDGEGRFSRQCRVRSRPALANVVRFLF